MKLWASSWGMALLSAVATLAGCSIPQTIPPQFLEPIPPSKGTSTESWQDAELPVIQGQLDIANALHLAMAYNPHLRSVLQDRVTAQAKRLGALSVILPKGAVVASYTRLNLAPSLAFGGQNISLGFMNNYSAQLVVTQPLFHGGAAWAAWKAAGYYSALSDSRIREAVQDTVFQVALAFDKVLLLRKQVDVSRTSIALATRHLTDVTQKMAVGSSTRFNKLRAQVALSNSQTRLLTVQNGLRQSVSDLLEILGVSPGSHVQITGRLTYRPVSVAEKDAMSKAFAQRPDLAKAKAAVNLGEQKLHQAYAAYFPQIDGRWTRTWSDPDPYIPNLDQWGNAWNVGVDVKWPLFDLSREEHLQEARAALNRSRILQSAARARAAFGVRSTLHNLKDAEAAIQTQNLALSEAREALRLAEVGFREGTLDQVSVMETRTALTRAELIYNRSLFNHVRARLALRKAMGDLVPGTVQNHADAPAVALP